MTKDEALKLALEALGWTDEWRPQGLKEEAITAIKAALLSRSDGEAKDEPWEKFCDSNCVWTDHHPDCNLAERKPLTDEEVIDIGTQYQWYDGDCERFDSIGFARAIEAKLKEKNT